MKSIPKGGGKQNIQEDQRGIFLVNAFSKIYESALKIQNEKQKWEHVTDADSRTKTKINSK